jgi:hypothetical protein
LLAKCLIFVSPKQWCGGEKKTTMKNISHGGKTINPANDPNAAIKLCLVASAGCGSKSNAWNWADEALGVAREFLPDLAPRLKRALGDDRWPDVAAAQKLFQ